MAYIKRGSLHTYKRAVHPEYALYNANHRFDTAAASPIGFTHTRYATTGAVNDTNAHPFVEERPDKRYVYAHNGCISNHRKLGSYEVDSQALGPLIVKHKVGKAHGSVGLVWVEQDADGEKLFVYRHAQRLRAYTYRSEAGDLFTVVASRKCILEPALGEPVAKHTLHDGVAYEIRPEGPVPAWSCHVEEAYNAYLNKGAARKVYAGG